MPPSHVILCDLPGLARDLARSALEAVPDAVVHHVTAAGLPVAVRRIRPLLVVAPMPTTEAEGARWLRLLVDVPSVRLLFLRRDGRSARVLQCLASEIVEMTVEALVRELEVERPSSPSSDDVPHRGDGGGSSYRRPGN